MLIETSRASIQDVPIRRDPETTVAPLPSPLFPLHLPYDLYRKRAYPYAAVSFLSLLLEHGTSDCHAGDFPFLPVLRY